MFNLEPEAYGMHLQKDDYNEEMQQAWKIATRQLLKIENLNTPRAKLLQIGKVIQIV